MAPPPSPDPRTLAADLFADHGNHVVGRLKRRYPEADAELCWDACTYAVLHVAGHFDRYDPNQASLTTFLTLVAKRRLQTMLKGERRRRAREQKKNAGAVTNDPPAAKSPLQELADRELAEAAKAEIAHTPEERLALELWLLKADYPDYARQLCLNHLSEEEGRAHVERLLARLRQRLHRYRLRLGREGEAP
jgi:DNA-directed RNA polymerase specialized sigma24 family protein